MAVAVEFTGCGKPINLVRRLRGISWRPAAEYISSVKPQKQLLCGLGHLIETAILLSYE